MTASELREKAREALKGKWGTAVLIVLIASLLSGISTVYTSVETIIIPIANGSFLNIDATAYTGFNFSYIFNVVELIIGGALTLGSVICFLGFVRGENIKAGDALNGFSEFGKAFVLQLVMTILIALWSILFLIPGIVKAYSYSMSFYVLRDNPNISATEAITESRRLMDGNKFRLFCLQLSFIGWAILGAITVIGVLWVIAYINTATAAFYQELIDREKAPAGNIDSVFVSG